jgi:hypothetical protein
MHKIEGSPTTLMSLAESVKKIEQWIAKILPAEQPTAKGEGRKEEREERKGNGKKRNNK